MSEHASLGWMRLACTIQGKPHATHPWLGGNLLHLLLIFGQAGDGRGGLGGARGRLWLQIFLALSVPGCTKRKQMSNMWWVMCAETLHKSTRGVATSISLFCLPHPIFLSFLLCVVNNHARNSQCLLTSWLKNYCIRHLLFGPGLSVSPKWRKTYSILGNITWQKNA